MEPKKQNPQDIFVAAILISVALIVAALVLYFHFAPTPAQVSSAKVPPVHKTAPKPTPSATATPTPTASPTTTPKATPSSNPEADAEQQAEKQEAQQAKIQKEEKAKEAKQEQCLDQAAQDRTAAEGTMCRQLYDQYVQQCSEHDCRDQLGWSQDMVLPPYLSCCERTARKKLGIDFMGPIGPTSTIPTCNLPPDAQASIQNQYETAKEDCMKL